ncbi:MAG TPA: sugar phosphate isomerase/epimerase [Bryobacteraceae bacterium]|nr:sugar phosphate isomerase/epimerase [Bryobacteraceae bacterium]
MTRREIVTLAAAAPLAAMAGPAPVPGPGPAAAPDPAPGPAPFPAPGVKFGVDLFSLRSQNWSPFELLDYCAARGAVVVHFSEIRFIGSLEPENLKRVREHAAKLGIEVEIGMRSICPTSKMFDPAAGTAEQQLSRMIDAAGVVGSRIVRAVLGSSEDRRPGPIESHIESTVKVLKNVRSKAVDANLKIAIENHAGDMQAREVKMLIEEAGRDFVGSCLDSGNPLWTIEDPHLTLETLHPYVLTSHLRDSAVWLVPEGAAVAWVRMGEGNVGIDDFVRQYAALCPGRALSLESIVNGPRVFPYRDPKFWEPYRNTPAWEFQRFIALAERGKARGNPPRASSPEESRAREREDLEASIRYTRKLLEM